MKNLLGILIISTVFFFSCKKENSTNNQNITTKYFLKTIETDSSIDWNLDGIYTDLISEIPNLKNSTMIINNRSKTINIIWYEPKINNYAIGYLPPLPPSPLEMDFLPVQNVFYFKKTEQIIRPYQSIENNIYTFAFPKIIIQNGDEMIFTTNLNVLTMDGIKTIIIKCKYKSII